MVEYISVCVCVRERERELCFHLITTYARKNKPVLVVCESKHKRRTEQRAERKTDTETTWLRGRQGLVEKMRRSKQS